MTFGMSEVAERLCYAVDDFFDKVRFAEALFSVSRRSPTYDRAKRELRKAVKECREEIDAVLEEQIREEMAEDKDWDTENKGRAEEEMMRQHVEREGGG